MTGSVVIVQLALKSCLQAILRKRGLAIVHETVTVKATVSV